MVQKQCVLKERDNNPLACIIFRDTHDAMPVVTQKMIAEATGVSTITVSRALRDAPNVSPETKQKIQEAADRLGYVADPMLSALVHYRTKQSSEYNKVAILCPDTKDRDWSSMTTSGRAVMQGITEACRDYGFSYELFHLRTVNNSIHRMQEILSARGIESVILTPTSTPNSGVYGTGEEDWKQFQIMRIEYSEDKPPSHYVGTDHFDMVVRCWEQLWSRGYRRIGLEVHQTALLRVHGIWEAAVQWKNRQVLPADQQIPVLIHEGLSKEQVLDYLQTNKVDAIIGRVRKVPVWIEESGVRIPEEVGWAGLDLRPEENEFAGMVQQRREMGRSAVTLLHRLKQERQFGALPYQRGLLLKGIWKEGRSVRPS